MNRNQNQVWPNDADGDVLRRMKASGFDFEVKTDIDFNVDFDDWPPAPELIELLGNQFAIVKMYEPNWQLHSAGSANHGEFCTEIAKPGSQLL